jgi:hypothetical protein
MLRWGCVYIVSHLWGSGGIYGYVYNRVCFCSHACEFVLLSLRATWIFWLFFWV